jgi:hypothetical protein
MKHLKKWKDDANFYSTPTDILSTSTFSSDQKLLFIVMMADLEMNGHIKWAQQTYADKTGKTRKYVNAFFKLCVDKKLLTPYEQNKVGSKHNKYQFNLDMFKRMIEINDKRYFQPVTSNDKPVTSNDKPVTSNDKPVTSNDKPVTTGNRYRSNIDRIENTDLYSEEGDDDVKTSPPSEEEMNALAETLFIDEI